MRNSSNITSSNILSSIFIPTNSVSVILIGGPQTGTRFRPLSFKVPKPLFPVGPQPLIHHHISACAKIKTIKSIFLIGNYNSEEPLLLDFLSKTRLEFPSLKIIYLQEYTTLGTAGALHHFRDILKSAAGNDSHIFVLNGDVLCGFPLIEMIKKCNNLDQNIMLTAKSEQKRQTLGCLIVDDDSDDKIVHFVEKPENFLPSHISCGVYLLNIETLFETITETISLKDQIESDWTNIDQKLPTSLEKSVFPSLVSNGNFYSYCLESLPGGMHWTQIKSPSSCLNANRLILLFAKNNVFIHPTAKIHKDASIGPNVSVGENCVIDEGVRIKESIILPGCQVASHSCIINSIIGWNTRIGSWNHIEGVIEKINPNQEHSVFESEQNVYFTQDGMMKKIVTIIGHGSGLQLYECLVGRPASVLLKGGGDTGA